MDVVPLINLHLINLSFGTNATFVPFEFKDEKTQDYTGFDIELIRAIGKRINKMWS
mgnify:CR=1 FL=1